MADKQIGIIGASSFIGMQILDLLTHSDWHVIAFSRQTRNSNATKIEWRCFSTHTPPESGRHKTELIPIWICTTPIWALHNHFDLFESYGVKRIVAFSSTSLFTKENSSDPIEKTTANKLAESEVHLRNWAETKGISWYIVRPTMVYGLGQDKNITEVIRLIRRWGFYPLLGIGHGLRQPVHVKDIAIACKLIIESNKSNSIYTLSGGEILTYREMIKRIFEALGKQPRFIRVPRWGFRLALFGLRFLSRYKHWSVTMADRMDQDLVFDHQNATKELGFHPRPFALEKQDTP